MYEMVLESLLPALSPLGSNTGLLHFPVLKAAQTTSPNTHKGPVVQMHFIVLMFACGTLSTLELLRNL